MRKPPDPDIQDDQALTDGVAAIVRLARDGDGGATGMLLDRHGPWPW